MVRLRGRRRRATLRFIINLIRDKLSLTRRLLRPGPKTTVLNAILRSTSHHPSAPPPKKHLTTILSCGDGSRNTAAACIKALVKRLSKTRSSFVAFKCLLVIHTIVHEGSSVLRSQLISVFSSPNGRRNYLKFSCFLDSSTIEAWSLSFWVRWYARFLESLLFTSTSSTSAPNDELLREKFQESRDKERVSLLSNNQLLRELELLVALVEDICEAPEMFNVEARRLISEAMELVGVDKKSVDNKIMVRANEAKDRAESLSFEESIELDCLLQRFEKCKERVLLLFTNNMNSVGDRLWGLVEELRKKMEQSTKEKLRY